MRVVIRGLRGRSPYKGLLLAVLLGAFVSGCHMPGFAPTTPPDSLVFTQVAQTFVAELTLAVTPLTATPPSAPPGTSVPSATQPAETKLPATQIAPSATQEPTQTSEPQITATETLNVIFEDDFSNKTGWFTADTQDFRFEFAEGGYRVINRTRNGSVWSIREVDEGDVRLEVDARRTAGPANGLFGLICRYVNDGNYYALMVASDGSYVFAKMEKGEWDVEKAGTAPPGLISDSDATVHIRADCVGNTQVLYVNGQELTRDDEDDISRGAVDLVTRTNPDSGLEVLFDNFRIIRP